MAFVFAFAFAFVRRACCYRGQRYFQRAAKARRAALASAKIMLLSRLLFIHRSLRASPMAASLSGKSAPTCAFAFPFCLLSLFLSLSFGRPKLLAFSVFAASLTCHSAARFSLRDFILSFCCFLLASCELEPLRRRPTHNFMIRATKSAQTNDKQRTNSERRAARSFARSFVRRFAVVVVGCVG